MEVKERPLEDLVQRIRDCQPFSYSRWGDSEWKAVFGHSRGYDRDRHVYFPQMCVDLKVTLESRPGYMLGLPGEVQDLYGDNVKVWLGSKRLHDLDWINADVFQEASARDQLYPLIEAIKAAPAFVMIGPPHLAKLNKFLDYSNFVYVPLRNCYLALKGVIREALGVSDHLPSGTVISISAGMPAKLLVDALHKRLGQRHFIIDFGSVWDRYVGVKSRPYMKDLPRVDVGEISHVD